MLFAKRWMKENGFTEESMKEANMLKIFGLSFLLMLFASFNLAMFVGKSAGACIRCNGRISCRYRMGIHFHGSDLSLRKKITCTLSYKCMLFSCQPDSNGVDYWGVAVGKSWGLGVLESCRSRLALQSSVQIKESPVFFVVI